MRFLESEIKITCIGDLMPSDTYYTLGQGIGSNIKNLTTIYSLPENKLFPDSDIIVCNLESPILKNSGDKKIPFGGRSGVINLLKNMSISIVSVANNHILDHGPEVLRDTVKILTENRIGVIGIKKGNISAIYTVNIKSKRVALAAFNAIPDHPENTTIAPLERDILFNTLYEIKKQSPDFIIFSFHWGNEYVTFPSPSQVDIAHELINNGVNIIIGHHPHVVQPVEKYNGGVIIYSLGNFLFDMFWSEKVRNGMQVDLLLNDYKSVDYEIIPFRIETNFIQDYTKTKAVFSILGKAEKKMKALQDGPREDYEREYLRECKKMRREARIKMKLYLLKKIFSLSSQSRELLFRNIKLKSRLLWINN